ncbi:CYP4F2 [Branchiostoma lanceolatum]|uniref:CYP4F2 protein n=1 Tax=Branchiostoma lanceolatum TaxID=7740 RepID=A0A8K0AAQ9_BRALA|nr:CYP4F2 [Branchiostoma lanceolatum]
MVDGFGACRAKHMVSLGTGVLVRHVVAAVRRRYAIESTPLSVSDQHANTVYAMFPSIYHLSPGGREFLRQCDFVHDTANSIIKKRREELILAEKKRLDFIDILLTAQDEDGRGMTDEEIREQVDTFLFAGHDTTSSTLCWTLYSLAQHP